MGALKSLIICFSVFSKIPMPFMDWEKEDMKYIFCFLPFVGVVMGAVFVGVYLLSLYINLPAYGFGIFGFVCPFLVNGGIHIDGFMDTVDALSSHKSKEVKQKILDDPHTGAFAIIHIILYILTAVFVFSTVDNLKEAIFMAVAFVVSRALVGVIAVSENLAKENGMLYTFVSGSNKLVTGIICTVWLIASIAVLEMLAPIRSIVILAIVFIFVLLFQNMTRKEFGGISGDLMGFFICVVEMICFLIMGIGDFIC